MTVQGGASQSITFVDDDDNELVYRKRSSSFDERLFSDDNFVYDEFDSILNQNSKEISVEQKFNVETEFDKKEINIHLTNNKSEK